MSKLAAWFPLHKDTKDWSGNKLHLSEPITTSMTRQAGVIGQCSSVDSTTKTDHYISPPLGLVGDHAMFCFLNVTELQNTSSANGVLGCHDHSNNSGTGITLKAKSSTSYSVSVNTGHGDSRTFHTYAGQTELSANKWYHVGFTWEQATRTLTIYVNGKVDYKRSGTIPEMYMLPDAQVALFAWSLSYLYSGSYRPAQKIQDVRIYNEIPTLKEIKEISQGRFLHLAMNQQSFGSVLDDPRWYAYSSYADITESTASYIKAVMKRSGTLAIRTDGLITSGKTVRLSGYVFRNGEPVTISVLSDSRYTDHERTINNPENGWFCSELTMNGEWVIHTNEGLEFPQINDVYEFKSLKVEVISEPTGINGIVRDNSGYKNDLAATGDLPQFEQIESNLGSGCYYFDNDSIYSIEPLAIGGNEVTLSTWVKSSSIGYDDWHPLITCNSVNCELKISSTGAIRTGFLINGTRKYLDANANLLDGEWHHVVSTYDGKVIRAYKDGLLVGELNAEGSLNVIDGKVSLGQQYMPKGQFSAKELRISNVMMFGRALSETDVESLFRQRLTIDKKGKMYATNLFEKPDLTRVNRKGQLISSKLAENNFKPTLIDYSNWRIGQDAAIGFSRNGMSTENIIAVDKNPNGIDDVVWQTRKVNTYSDADGGFNTSTFNVDKTRLYRFSCWFNRKVLGNGRFYFGTRGYDSGGNTALETMGGSLNSNPYFLSGDAPFVDEWFLIVGYVYPAGTTQETRVDSGVYKASGEKIPSNTLAFRWAADTTKALIRAYLYYSSNVSTVQQFYRPRVDLCDGSEPPLGDLLRCKEHTPLVSFYNENGVYSNQSHALGQSVTANEFIEN